MFGRSMLKAANSTSTDTVMATDGTRLFCRDWGTGKPVVFVHSWAAHSDMWQYQMADLTARGLRCVSFDRRGHGRSGQPDGGYDCDTLADDLAAVIETHDLHDVTLVGHSMGSCEIVRYLTRHGAGRVAGAALVAPVTPFLLKTVDNPHGIDGAMFEALRGMWSRDFPKWVADNTAPFFTPKTSPEMMRWGADMLLQCPLKVAIDCQRAFTTTDFRTELREIEVPVLVIHGDADASAPIDLTGRPTAALLPSATFELYEGAPHGLFVTHMDRLNDDLYDFALGLSGWR